MVALPSFFVISKSEGVHGVEALLASLTDGRDNTRKGKCYRQQEEINIYPLV
jgi:hypothetical protein